ncbi:DUF1638 domain-containing protein [Desulfogranum japonicum]|uniref:DUF1638 domain-containing protein n=1 Tax=Desulfogranum japonicum TaxID=231447 RepID=UPI0004210C5D|nr:DUF1638 domain-containing protein [Desulfogranum japonicum]
MAVLGILTCEIMELEIASLVALDTDLTKITVVDDHKAQHLISSIESQRVHTVYRIPHISAFDPENSGDEALIRVLELGLHRRRDLLKEKLEQESRQMDRYIHCLFLGYGQCGGVLADPAETVDVTCPVFYPRFAGKPVADCIGICLGGDEEYYREQRQVAGTYFLTPGWCRHWKDMFGSLDTAFNETMSTKLCRRILRGYKRLLLVHTPVMASGDMRSFSQELIEMSDLEVQEREGTLSLLEQGYREAKKYLGTGR